jgi:hypothetical protein
MTTLRDTLINLRIGQSKLCQALDHEFAVQVEWEKAQNHPANERTAINNTLWSLRRELKAIALTAQEIDAIEDFVLITWKPKSHAKVKLPEIKKKRFFNPTRQLN